MDFYQTGKNGLPPSYTQMLPLRDDQSTLLISPPLSDDASPNPSSGCISTNRYLPALHYFNGNFTNHAFIPPPSPQPSPPSATPSICPSAIANHESSNQNHIKQVPNRPILLPYPVGKLARNGPPNGPYMPYIPRPAPLTPIYSDSTLFDIFTHISSSLFVGMKKRFKSNIDNKMIAFRHVNPRQLHAELVLKPPHLQLEHFILRTGLCKTQNERMERFVSLVKQLLNRTRQLGHLAPMTYSYGSLTNGLGMFDATMDICLRFEGLFSPESVLSHQTAVKALEVICKVLLTKLPVVEYPTIDKGVQIVAGEHGPIMKMDFACCFGNLQPDIDRYNSTSLDGDVLALGKCNIIVTSMNGVHSSALLKSLCKLDQRFRQMTMLLRYWAKQNGLIGPGVFSSYAFTLLVMYFLQQTTPPILPPISRLQELAQQNPKTMPFVINGFHFEFCEDARLSGGQVNPQTTAQLVVQFFRFCYEFNFDTRALRPRFGTDEAKPKLYKLKEDQYGNSFVRSHFVIEDPLVLDHNPASVFLDRNVARWQRAVLFVLQHISEHNFVALLTDPAIKCFAMHKYDAM